jgi:glycosyltransferase involved in cell wall biosynthesis
VNEERLRAEYEGASLLVFVPLVEGFGLPPLEAMALGIPVVASRVSSIPEVCGDAALLVQPEDPCSVAEAIGRVLTDHALAARLCRAGRARALQLTWDATARATRDVYESAASGRGP